MGYDMSIIDPDPWAVAERDRISALLYGSLGAYDMRNNWSGIVPDRVPGTDVTDLHRHYVPGTGDPGFWLVLDEIAALQEEMRPVEAQVYFRLNIAGMSWCRDFMWPAEMIYEPANPPEWPDVPEGYDWGDYDDEYGLPNESCPPQFRDYVLATQARLAYCEERPGINVQKLGSNDGWIVTPIECAGALHQWKVNAENPEALPTRDGRAIEWWPDWLTFLLHASTHGGFRVY